MGDFVKTVYLCGAINEKTDAECNDWRARAKHLLGESFKTLDPMRRDFRGREDDCYAEIVSGDLCDIDASDFLLVNAGAPSWGTAMEVFYAHANGKKVIAFTDAPRVSPWLRRHCHFICDSLERACMAAMNYDAMVEGK